MTGVSALVTRKPMYFFVNVIIPMSTLTFLALLQFLLPAERLGTNVTFRITYSVTILLTTATYKLFIASALPVGLAYTTLLDEYVLFCYLLQVMVVSETAVVGALVQKTEISSALGNEWLGASSTTAVANSHSIGFNDQLLIEVAISFCHPASISTRNSVCRETCTRTSFNSGLNHANDHLTIDFSLNLIRHSIGQLSVNINTIHVLKILL